MFAEPYTFVIYRDKLRTAYKLLRIEKVAFLKIFTRMLISEASQQPFRVLRELKDVVFRSSMIVCFPLFFISPDRFKTDSGEFRTERIVEIFIRLRMYSKRSDLERLWSVQEKIIKVSIFIRMQSPSVCQLFKQPK